MNAAMQAKPQPFRSAADAWFWTMQFLAARRDGAGAAFDAGGTRPCEPDDVVKVLDRLYRQRRLTLAHARILRIWGEKGEAPGRLNANAADARLWSDAMVALELALRMRGIVG